MWGRHLGDATLTAAILDRLAMHAIRIDSLSMMLDVTAVEARP